MPTLHESPDDSTDGLIDRLYDQRRVYQCRIDAMRRQGISYDRAVDAVVGPVGTFTRDWWETKK
jgi:hypothetical protein